MTKDGDLALAIALPAAGRFGGCYGTDSYRDVLSTLAISLVCNIQH
jgi:hypothetical protein